MIIIEYPRIGVILVNYNGKNYNSECIESITNSTYKNISIILVDNASIDDSTEDIINNFKQVIVIKNNENLGFSGANNIGIKYAIKNGCEYVLLLNNDTVIKDDMIEMMLKTSMMNNAVISPKIYYFSEPNKLWSAGSGVNWIKGLAYQIGMNETDIGIYNEIKTVPFATGCCLLIHKHVFDLVGYLNDEYFLYYEDTDFSTRIIEAGIKIIYEPKAILWHKVSSSTGGDESPNYIYYNTRNRLYFNNKFNRKNALYYLSYFYLTRIIKFINWFIAGKSDMINATICAIRDYKLGKMGKRQ